MGSVGQVVANRYRICAEVGHGGMSTVYLAVDTKLNKRWALKEISNILDPEQRALVIESLTNEANLLKGVSHPAIPRIVDLFQDHGMLYVLMDYVEGRTLSSVLAKEGPQSENRVVDWAIQLCDILDYLHRRNPRIIYRDVKPSNIMLTQEGAIRLIDFGIAREIPDDKTDRRKLHGDPRPLGTPGFGAPEQFEEDGTIDDRTDVYALGVTMFYLLTGINPRTQKMVPIRKINDEFSQSLEEIITKATQAKPEKRYDNCAEMTYALRNYRERDAAHRRVFSRNIVIFRSMVVASIVFALAACGSAVAAAVTRRQDFNLWMNVARQSADDAQSEDSYLKAIEIRPGDPSAYEGLIARYEADGKFTDDEEETLNSVLTEHYQELKDTKNVEWGELAYKTGLLYWYFYQPTGAGSQSLDDLRVRAASPWMHDAAEIESFDDCANAKIYSEIADFQTQIVSKINQGEDAGRYKPHFDHMVELMGVAENEDNPVVRLGIAEMTLNALVVYPRSFRSDGVDQKSMEALAKSARALAQNTQTHNDNEDKTRSDVLATADNADTAIEDAFTDVEGSEQ